MEMREFIEMGEKKAGTQKQLAEYLDTRYTTLGLVKNGKKSLTTALCIKLARYIEVDELEVIAASNLIIEKDEERRKIFESCLKRSSKAASIAMIIGATALSAPSTNSFENSGSYHTSVAKQFILC
ncbi:Helix-turn-helix [Nitrosomonas marina]|uniref:Helix-turn-helix n=1 Tax=Nitrosomonas marina TaxID=917 RepID=A0A1I0G2U7_9PROT|nr:helix-turn-helix transcriptional regulator [Nitrosomonas marina]SET65015.1 Helix-turn-helix [Nitrosomonas marina]